MSDHDFEPRQDPEDIRRVRTAEKDEQERNRITVKIFGIIAGTASLIGIAIGANALQKYQLQVQPLKEACEVDPALGATFTFYDWIPDQPEESFSHGVVSSPNTPKPYVVYKGEAKEKKTKDVTYVFKVFSDKNENHILDPDEETQEFVHQSEVREYL